jgi:hypothetical protein
MSLSALYAVQGISQVGETYVQQGAIRDQDKYQKSQAAISQRRLEIQAKDAEARGSEAAGKINRETTKIRGAQRAGYAGQGVAMDSGTPGMVGAETELYGGLDALTAKNNAWREAWGLRSEAAQVGQESRMKSLEAKTNRRSTIITGGLSAIQSGMMAYASKTPKFTPRNPTEAKFNNQYAGKKTYGSVYDDAYRRSVYAKRYGYGVK